MRRALAGAQRVGPWLSVGPIRPGRRLLWSERGGFAVGNAAGEAHPILGEGISMAMQGAFLLCSRLEAQRDALLAGEPQDGAARLYERDWRRAFGARIRWAALFAALAMRPAARALLPALKAWPALLTAGAYVGGKARPAPVVPLAARLRDRSGVPGAAHMLRWRPLRRPNADVAGEFMTTTFDQIRAIIMRDFELPAERLQRDTLLEEIELDSLAITELVFEIEDEFKVTAENTIPPFKTLGDIADYVSRLVAESDAAPRPAPKRAAAKAKPTSGAKPRSAKRARAPAGGATPRKRKRSSARGGARAR